VDGPLHYVAKNLPEAPPVSPSTNPLPAKLNQAPPRRPSSSEIRDVPRPTHLGEPRTLPRNAGARRRPIVDSLIQLCSSAPTAGEKTMSQKDPWGQTAWPASRPPARPPITNKACSAGPPRRLLDQPGARSPRSYRQRDGRPHRRDWSGFRPSCLERLPRRIKPHVPIRPRPAVLAGQGCGRAAALLAKMSDRPAAGSAFESKPENIRPI